MNIDLDIAYDDTLENTLATIPADIAVMYRVVDANGPGGGFPIVRFAGDDDAVARLVTEWYSPDDADSARHLLTGE